MSTVILDNTGFSITYWSRYSLEAFLTEAKRDGFFKNSPQQDALLRIAYELIVHDAARITKKIEKP